MSLICVLTGWGLILTIQHMGAPSTTPGVPAVPSTVPQSLLSICCCPAHPYIPSISGLESTGLDRGMGHGAGEAAGRPAASHQLEDGFIVEHSWCFLSGLNQLSLIRQALLAKQVWLSHRHPVPTNRPLL